MAAVMGAVQKGVEGVKDAVKGVVDQVDLPQGQWEETGAMCDGSCCLGCICPCIQTYVVWGKLMMDDAQKMGCFVFLGYCIGLILSVVIGWVAGMTGIGALRLLGLPFFLLCQAAGIVNQRKKLGAWMNIPEEKLAEPKDMACACCCWCFAFGAENKTVENWMSTTMLVQAPLKAAHEAKKMMDSAVGQALA